MILHKKILVLLAGLSGLLPGTAATAGDVLTEPLFTRYARIYSAPTLDLTAEYFKDTPVQEAEDFDGYRLQLDFTWPINTESQLELLLPLYTDGEATLLSAIPRDVDIDGYGGTFEYASLLYERRFRWLDSVTGVNTAWRLGAGAVADSLDVTLQSSDIRHDRYNHSGYRVMLGLKADDDVAGGDYTLLGNADLNFYLDSDDLNLSENDPDFLFLELYGAVIYNGFGNVKPALEMLFSHDFEDYSALSLAPELLYTAADSWDLKLGVPFRVTSDGEKYSVRAEVTHRF